VRVAFVRTKRVDGGEYFQLVENYRDGGKVRQRVLAHLGRYPTVEAAIEESERGLEWQRSRAERDRAKARSVLDDWRSYPAHEPELARPVPGERVPWTHHQRQYWDALDSADKAERRAAALEEKLATLRALMASGKARPDPPEAKARRAREREAERERYEALRPEREALMEMLRA
jgi:hypothetical protein